MSRKKIYFPNLNGLRFIAAFLVIIHHIEQFKSVFKIDSYWGKIGFVDLIGRLGVVLFFVLSGFLITYLLLAEKKEFKKISIRNFYIRRILRIWPLYFLIVLLAFFILPYIDIFTIPEFGKEVIHSNLFFKLFLYAIFFPNLVLSIFGIIPYASHTWSIGAEEQFYLIWPLILQKIKRHYVLTMFVVIIFYIGFKFFLLSTLSNALPYKVLILSYWNSFPIDCMAIGGFYAIILFQKRRLLRLFLRKDLFYFSIILVLSMMISGFKVPLINNEFYSIFFGLIILNFAVNDKIKISLENKFFNYLGKISYGLYMYHPVGIMLGLTLLFSINIYTNWIVYPLCLLITVILASVSYKYFESYFLKFKRRFSKILSGRNAAN